MSDVYAQIDMTYSPGAVLNLQVVNSGDYLDPAFTWVDLAGLDPQPFIWCSYDGTNFSNCIASPFLSTIPSGIPTGTATTLTPFTLSEGSSGFTVSLNGNILTIGCCSYDYKWLRYAIYMMQIENVVIIGPFAQVPMGVAQGSFIILTDDVNAVYAAICTLV
jgi:hypothetical protein